MQKNTLEKKELYNKITLKVKEIIGENLKAIIVFGSTIYLGKGKDIDLIIIIDKEINIRGKLELEYKLKQILQKIIPNKIFDIHVFNLKEFKENLQPGTMLSGLALGYEIIYGEQVVEPLILGFLKKLSREKYILHNKYGTWNLSFHAKITYKLKTRKTVNKVQYA